MLTEQGFSPTNIMGQAYSYRRSSGCAAKKVGSRIRGERTLGRGVSAHARVGTARGQGRRWK